MHDAVSKRRSGTCFKTRPSTYHIGIAPTSRAHCRACKRLVSKGETRVSITAFVRPGRSTCFVRCVDCIDSSFARVVLSVYRTPERVPVDDRMDRAEAERVRGLLRSPCAEAVVDATAFPSLDQAYKKGVHCLFFTKP